MTTVVSSGDELYDLLACLGESVDAVADKLRAAGVTGKPDEPDCCPVAVWLHCETALEAHVDGEGVRLKDGWNDDDDSIRVKLPPAIAEFVHRFDDYEYPDLIDPDEDGNP